ncbi:MAG: type III PLP-dependent enzyme [Verrucomicrobia bacterium]|nr:type III PLP-dependent enzyme [Verrucomicrobiota bacterium]
MNSTLANQIVTKHGTPLYAYDLAEVSQRAAELRAELPAGSSVCYSFKANPLPALARRVRESGGRAEITSEGELAAAQAAGFTGAEMLFGGPGKTRTEIQLALKAGVRRFSVESFRDLALISEMCVAEKVMVEVLLRVNPSDAPDARLAMTGVESQFGFEEALLTDASARERLKLPQVKVIGVHIYFGTQVAGVEALVTNTRRALASAERVQQALDVPFSVVNVGGGFPWPYGNDHARPSLDGLREKLDEVWSQSPFAAQGVQLWFEAGRYLSASSGWLIAQVLEVKSLPTKTFVILDTGIHHLGGMAGLGRVPRGGVTVFNLSRDVSAEPVMTADVVGPLCTPLDSLARGLKIPAVQSGDLIGIPNVGAYGLTASLLAFLSHPPPIEVTHEKGQECEAWQLRHGHAQISA